MSNIKPLPHDLVDVALRELGETDERRDSCMDELRSKLEAGKVYSCI